MVSYQSTDADAAELLHEELALRGFVVVHDFCTFASGSRIADEMNLGVEACHALISYLTPESLYLDAEPDAPKPALTEFCHAMDRRRRTSSEPDSHFVVLPITKSLGSRSEAAATVFAETGESIDSLWVKSTRPDDPNLSTSEAADVAREALTATLEPGSLREGEPVTVSFVTRGDGQPPQFLTIDATTLVGGSRRAGDSQDWSRIVEALRDVERVLARTSSRDLNLVVRAHISGAVAMGRIFNQVGRWQPALEGRYGNVAPSPMGQYDQLRRTIDPQRIDGTDLSCEISLVGQPVFGMAREAIRAYSLELAERLQLSPRTPGEIDSNAASLMAAEAAWELRGRITELRPPRTHVFCASPVEIAVLLGYRLTALGTDLHLYEREGDAYQRAIVLPADIP